MPFVMLIVGVLLIVAGVRNTQGTLFTLLKSDFSGQGSFIPWIVAIAAIGGLGYIKPIRPITTAFLALVILVMFLSNGGFFDKFVQATGMGNGSVDLSNPLTQSNFKGAQSLFNTPTPQFGSLPSLPTLTGSQQ
jgi:hypothetical protein